MNTYSQIEKDILYVINYLHIPIMIKDRWKTGNKLYISMDGWELALFWWRADLGETISLGVVPVICYARWNIRAS